MGWGIVASMGVYAVFRNRAVPYFVLAILPLLAPALARAADHLVGGAGRARRRRLGVAGTAACGIVLAASILDQGVFSGGCLMWRRWPANQVIIDGRYDAVLFDETLLETYNAAYESPAALDRITAAYSVELLVLNANP